MKLARAELVVRGRVQGVFFRQSTRQTALGLGLTGWARNNPDGSVSVVFEGQRQQIDQAVAWCHQGPPAAAVTDVSVGWGDYSGEFTGFQIR
jgi:acylphosphatase